MRLLIVGKLNGHIGTASRIALSRGAKVQHVDTISDALDFLRQGKGADLVMIDVSLDIKSLVSSLEQERFSLPVIACGLGTKPEPAADAIRAGAKEYVPLPPDADLIAAVIETVAREETTFIYKDPSITQIAKLAQQIAPSDASVLITGASGTGKEVMARFIHENSKRKDKQFVSVNCAAIPENLLESELFGHEKGAFTGAVARRIGKFEEANGGTLLLDEISEMHPLLQAKLLRAIQERVIDRVGGTKPVPVDIRIIATSNRDLEQAVKEKSFREDLYFRLNVVPLHLPPLRDRPMDILMIAEHFTKKYATENNIEIPTISDQARTLLRQYSWKGNIRELENVMHRAVLLSSAGTITDQTLMLTGVSKPDASTLQTNSNAPQEHGLQEGTPLAQEQMQPFQTGTNPLVGRTVSEVERDLIIGTLTHCLGNRTQAANILGISIRTLRNKLNQYMNDGYELQNSKQASGSK